jgi:hypothetical protein
VLKNQQQCNRGGRAYLVAELRKIGYSRRRAVAVVNLVFQEMGLALQRGEYVEFPFGYLMAEKRMRQYWWDVGDEPMRPWFIEHKLDNEGERRLEGEGPIQKPPGWSRKQDKESTVYVWDRALRRCKDEGRRLLKRLAKLGQSTNKRATSAKQVQI